MLCKNARLNRPDRLALLIDEVDDVAFDVICFSETRAEKADVILQGGHRLITALYDYKFAGVGILIHRRWADKVTQIHGTFGRVIYVDISITSRLKVRVISVYMPHGGLPKATLDDTYRELRRFA